MEPTERNSLRVVIYQEGEVWHVQGIEHDICTSGEALAVALSRFDVTASLEAKEKGGMGRIAPAPKHFEQMWDKALVDAWKTKRLSGFPKAPLALRVLLSGYCDSTCN